MRRFRARSDVVKSQNRRDYVKMALWTKFRVKSIASAGHTVTATQPPSPHDVSIPWTTRRPDFGRARPKLPAISPSRVRFARREGHRDSTKPMMSISAQSSSAETVPSRSSWHIYILARDGTAATAAAVTLSNGRSHLPLGGVSSPCTRRYPSARRRRLHSRPLAIPSGAGALLGAVWPA